MLRSPDALVHAVALPGNPAPTPTTTASLPEDMTPEALRQIACVLDAYEAAMKVLAAEVSKRPLVASDQHPADLRRWADEIERQQ